MSHTLFSSFTRNRMLFRAVAHPSCMIFKVIDSMIVQSKMDEDVKMGLPGLILLIFMCVAI